MDKLTAFTATKGKYQYKSVFGLDKEEFEKLFTVFEDLYRQEAMTSYEKRKSLYASTDNGLTARLVYIKECKLRQYLHVVLHYIRHYPTFEELGWKIGKTKQGAFEMVHQWFVLLIKSLDKCRVLPARNIKDILPIAKDLLGVGLITEEELDLIIDVTERRINRPNENQKVFYSGKKNIMQ